ncbi:MAG: hypothetical protein QNJ42_06355 [Crocosphaera sp.]|nr:hypothetical protein [Crocosphaera sp.]
MFNNIFKFLDNFLIFVSELAPDIKIRRGIVVTIFIFIPFFLWMIDSQTHFFFFLYLSKKVNILKELMSLNSELVNDKIFVETYYQTLIEIHNIQYFPFYQQIVVFLQKGINFVESITFLKFFTGAFLGIILIIYGIFEVYIKKENSQDIFLGAVIFTIITGIIGVLIPIIFFPIVNYILYIVIQICLVLLLSKFSNTPTNNNTN